MKAYPDSLEIDCLSASLLEGGSSHNYLYASEASCETVVDWYNEHYGHFRVVECEQETWYCTNHEGMSILVTVTAMTPDMLPRLRRLEVALQPLQRTIIRMDHRFPGRRRRGWLSWLRW